MKEILIKEKILLELITKNEQLHIKVDALLQKVEDILDFYQNKLTILKTRSTYLSRQEVCKLLNISLPSLSSYTKKDFLQSYRIGSRVLYKTDEVELAIQKLTTSIKRNQLKSNGN